MVDIDEIEARYAHYKNIKSNTAVAHVRELVRELRVAALERASLEGLVADLTRSTVELRHALRLSQEALAAVLEGEPDDHR